MTEHERTVINFRGYCLFCLGKVSKENSQQSPFSTPTSSPLSTPLRARYRNIHSLPLEERIAPFTDLCRYLDVDIPDAYAFGDGLEPEMLTPPLCEKCHDLSARLCLLQDELQYLQLRISNTVKRIYQRVTGTCDQRRGALKRESFQNEFKRTPKSKGSLSRGRAETLETRKVTNLVKAFQMKVMEKEHEVVERKRRETTFISSECRNPEPPMDDVIPIQVEIVNLDQDDSSDAKESEGKIDEIVEDGEPEEEAEEEEERYLPLEETLRSIVVIDDDILNNDHEFELVGADHINSKITQPESELSTMLCNSYDGNAIRETGEDDEQNIDVAIMMEKNDQIKDSNNYDYPLACSPVKTRAQAKRRFESRFDNNQPGLTEGLLVKNKRRKK